jgi:hypothetical protein
MLRRWVRESEQAAGIGADVGQPREVVTPAFVQLPMPASPSPPVPLPGPAICRIDVEIQRNGATLRASLPMDSRSAAWLREVTG